MHGHLSTFLYAFPILRRSPAANIRANCLRNSSTFPTVLSYLSEYTLVPSEESLSALFQVLVLVGENNQLPFPMADYSVYTYSNPEPVTTFPQLVPRKKFEHWFTSLFFRLVLPMRQHIHEPLTVVLSPLNLCVLFRLISYLVKIGYPAHWLGDLLSNLVSGTVSTSARPPTSEPISPAEAAKEWPLKKLCTAPFAVELRILARVFAPILPFGIPDDFAAKGEIKKFTFKIPDYDNYNARPSCLLLVFFDTKLLPEAEARKLQRNLREVMDPEGNKAFKEFREKGLVAFSTFEWDGEGKEAAVWAEEGWVREMVVDGTWMVAVWRSDTWGICCQGMVKVTAKTIGGEVWGSKKGINN